MARKATLGAEFQSAAADIEVDSTSGSTISIDTSIKRTGAASWKFVGAASGPFVTRQYTSANGDTYVRFYLYVQSMTTASNIAICLIRDGTSGNNANIRLNRDSASTFHLELWNEQASAQLGSDSSTLNTGQWYRVEFNYVRSTGAMSARIDGVQFASGTGSTNLNSNTLRFGSIDSSTMTINFDDIAVNDTTGSFQNSWPGAGGVFRMNPNNSGDANTFATQTGGTAGASNNYTRLLETTPDDATTFNGSSTLNQEDLVNFDPSGLSSSDTINVVEIWTRYRNSTADATAAITFELEKTGSGTKTNSTAIVPNSTTWRTNANAVPKVPPIVSYQDPDAANWTNTTLDTLQAGYKLTTGPGTAGRRIDVSTLTAIIDYTPATTTPQTIVGSARIEKSSSQNQTGLARIEKSASQTATGRGRLQKSVSQSITGQSRIQISTSRTITGKAAIQRSTAQTITGGARVTTTTLKTIQGASRIQLSVVRTILGISRITVATSRTVTGVANISSPTVTTTKTITATARIQVSSNSTIAGKARITKSTSRTVLGGSRIQISSVRTIQGRSRLEKFVSVTIQGRSRITLVSQNIVAGRAYIVVTKSASVLGTASILSQTIEQSVGVTIKTYGNGSLNTAEATSEVSGAAPSSSLNGYSGATVNGSSANAILENEVT